MCNVSALIFHQFLIFLIFFFFNSPLRIKSHLFYFVFCFFFLKVQKVGKTVPQFLILNCSRVTMSKIVAFSLFDIFQPKKSSKCDLIVKVDERERKKKKIELLEVIFVSSLLVLKDSMAARIFKGDSPLDLQIKLNFRFFFLSRITLESIRCKI